jgi:hypothetical protein
MSEIKHTGGVWILDRRDPDRLYVAQQSGDGPGGRICEVFMNCLVREDGREANARLIAAAPALLEVLREITALMEACDGPNRITRKARAAIIQATGTQS